MSDRGRAPALASAAQVQADFDRIAELPSDSGDSGPRYYSWLLNQAPAHVDSALDVGCGAGKFARMLSPRAGSVLALDFSTKMIELARKRSAGFTNIDYRETDVLKWDWPVERFDCIASLTALHHLPMDEVLPKLAAALRPGGVLLILDLWRPASLIDHAYRVAAFPMDRMGRWIPTGTPFLNREAQRAWTEHAKTDHYLSVSEVRALSRRFLPGAEVRRRLYWRYSLVWRKP